MAEVRCCAQGCVGCRQFAAQLHEDSPLLRGRQQIKTSHWTNFVSTSNSVMQTQVRNSLTLTYLELRPMCLLLQH